MKVAFRQSPYTLPDDGYGTSLKLQAIEVIKASGSAGVDSGDMDAAEAAAMFGTSKGYKVSEPNVTTTTKKKTMISKDITVDDMVGLYRCDMVLKLPEIRVTRWKKSRRTSAMRCNELSTRLLMS